MTKTVLGSENTQYGFYGTINNYNSTEETEHKWAEAFTTLLDLSGLSPYEIRAYLDSRSGRKLADCCNDSKVDVKSVIIREYFKWIDHLCKRRSISKWCGTILFKFNSLTC